MFWSYSSFEFLDLRCPSWLLNNKHNVVGFLPIGNAESWDLFIGEDFTAIQGLTSSSTGEIWGFVPPTLDTSGRFQKRQMLY